MGVFSVQLAQALSRSVLALGIGAMPAVAFAQSTPPIAVATRSSSRPSG